MTKTDLTKTIVNNLTAYGSGAVAANIIRSNRPHSTNKAVDLVIDLSIFMTCWAVKGVVRKPIRAHTDQQIDDMVVWWKTNVTKN